MNVPNSLAGAFIGTYGLARRLGLLKTRPGQWIFSKSYFLYKRYVEDSFAALAKRHPEFFVGGNVLDIGANIGYTSQVFARVIEPSYHVYSFEPETFNGALLDRLASRFGGRIVPIHAAVGDHDGTVDMWCNSNHHGDHRIATRHFLEKTNITASTSVPILKIDTFVQQRAAPFPIRFIKIDVQGYELAVCRGMERTLELNPEVVLALEYSPDGIVEMGFRPETLLGWLAEKGFHPHGITRDGSFLPVSGDRIVECGYTDLLFLRSP